MRRAHTFYVPSQMKDHQLTGQRQSNEFLLKRVEDLEKQVAKSRGTSGALVVGTD